MSSESLFRSSGFLENGAIADEKGRLYLIEQLPAFLRTLLVADGTVTKTLEAYFWEPVIVLPILQQICKPDLPIPELLQVTGTHLLQREVKLIGKKTGRCYAQARSFLILDYLPEHFAHAIKEGQMGIGELLREQGVETFRDIVELGFQHRGACKDERLKMLNDDLVSRSYRISVSGTPAILVTEYFPVSLYRS